MKKVVFLGFCLLGAQGASAESLDVFFQEQSPQEQTASPVLSPEESPKKTTSEPTVVKPQVLYLEDLEPAEKPKPKPKTTPKAAAAPAKTKTKSVSVETKAASTESSKTTPVDLPTPLATEKTKTSPTSETGKLKTEPLPETFAKTTKPTSMAAPTPAPQTTVQKSFIEPRNGQTEQTPNTLPESMQTLSSFREQNSGQYAPFATQTSRQQAAHSLVTQAKNEGRSYPAGLDPFVIEFDQTFTVLSPNPAIRDLYKTATLTPPTLKEQPLLSFKTTPAPTPVLSLPVAAEVTKAPKTHIAKEQEIEIPQQQESKTLQTQPLVPAQQETETQDTQETVQQEDATLTHQEETISQKSPEADIAEEPSSPMVFPNTLVLDDAQTVPLRDSDALSSPLATVMLPETAQTLDVAYRNLLDQVAASYHDGTLSVIHITGYVNTRPTHGEEVRGYTQIQSLGRRGATLVVDYLKGKNVPESAMAYRIIPTSTIALQNPFYDSVSTENTLRLDIAGGKS